MRIIYPNGIIIECTRDEYLESIKDDQVNANKVVITAINDFKTALLSKLDSLKDVSNESFLILQKFFEEYKNQISEKTCVEENFADLGELSNFFRTLKDGHFEYKRTTEGIDLLHKIQTPPEQTNTPETQEQTDNEQNSEDMLEQIIYVWRSSDAPYDFGNPAETYKNPKEAADAHNMTIQDFMKYLDSETVYNGFVFMTKKRALQKSRLRKKSNSQTVYVYDENWDNERVFDSVTQASRILAIAILTIKNNMDKGKLVKHKYYFRSRKLPKTETTVLESNQYLTDKTEEDIPEIEKTMREIHENDKKPYEVSHPVR